MKGTNDEPGYFRRPHLADAVPGVTVMANLMGLCAATLPAGVDVTGMPVGLQMIAAPWKEPELLRTARAVEQVRDGEE